LWCNGGMTIDNCINLISAILIGDGTLFLGIMAWRNIRQTRNIQKTKKRERLLNEIIEWAEDILKGGDSEASYQLASENIGHDVRQTLLSMSSIDTFERFKTRSLYTLLVSRTFEDNLGNVVEKAIHELNKITELLYKLFGANNSEGIKELGKQRYKLLNPAINAVIDKLPISKLKIKVDTATAFLLF